MPLFLLIIPLAAVSIGEAAGIGASAIGIGAGIKGALDYRKARAIQDTAQKRYQEMAGRIGREGKVVQKRFEDFGELKLKTYTGIIREAVSLISRFKDIALSSFKDSGIAGVSFLPRELDAIETVGVKASEILSCLSAGINTALGDTLPYNDLALYTGTVGAFGMKKLSTVPLSMIAVIGIQWGITGNQVKARSACSSASLDLETERMESALAGFKAMLARIDEGETLIAGLTERLRPTLDELKNIPDAAIKEVSDATLSTIEMAVSLTRSLKDLIEVDIVGANGLLTGTSGVLFKKIRKEYISDV